MHLCLTRPRTIASCSSNQWWGDRHISIEGLHQSCVCISTLGTQTVPGHQPCPARPKALINSTFSKKRRSLEGNNQFHPRMTHLNRNGSFQPLCRYFQSVSLYTVISVWKMVFLDNGVYVQAGLLLFPTLVRHASQPSNE